MRTVLTTLLTVALLVAVVLDGIGMFLAYQASQDVAATAAQQAAIEYVSSRGNLRAAEQAATRYAAEKNAELVRLELHQSGRKWFEAEAQAKAQTYVFKYVPGLNRYVDQTAIAVARF